MRLELSSYVEGDLQEIAEWIAQDNPRRAVSFIREIRDAFRKIGEGPLLYQLRPEIGEDARMAVVGRYVILFGLAMRQSGSNASSLAAANFLRCFSRGNRSGHSIGWME
jgi:plasmid stabilization system protein ParE